MGQPGLLAGDPDLAIGLNGAAAFVDVPTSPSLDLAAAFTLSALVKPSVTGDKRQVLAKMSTYWLQVDGSGLELAFVDSAGTVHSLVVSSGLTAETTALIVGTYDGQTLRAYINGSRVGALAATCQIAATTSDFRLGSWDGTSNFFDGTLDEAFVANQAIDAEAVAALYASATLCATVAGTPDAAASEAGKSGDSSTPSPDGDATTATDAGTCGAGSCSGHGTCNKATGVPECTCDSGYYAVGTTCLASADCISIVSCGAVAGGGDATAAIQSCLAKGKAQGKPVCVPAGVFSVGALTVDSVTLVGLGDASELYGPNPTAYGISVLGTAPTIASLKMYTVGTTRTGQENAITMGSATNYLIDNVTVDGANAVGIDADATGTGTRPSGPGRVTNNRVSNTLADAIHNDHATHDVYIAGNTVNTSGDDMIAIVSYEADGQGFGANNNILVELNILQNGQARGIAVVGGNNITIRNNKISQTQYAGIYVSSESSYTTWGDDNVLVKGNTVDHPAQKANTGHSGLFTYSDTSYLVQNVLYLDNAVTNDGNGYGERAFGNISNIFASGNTLDGAALSGNGMTTPTSAQSASITGSTVVS